MWIAARHEPQREKLALHCLALAGYPTYAPRIRERIISRGRVIERTAPLLPSYVFVSIEAQWLAVRWSPGIRGMVMRGPRPSHVSEEIISDIRKRERDELIELPRWKCGDHLRVTRGPLEGLAGLYAGHAPQERVLILLSLLGAARPIALPMGDVEAAVWPRRADGHAGSSRPIENG
jgi:transcription antitermination factor NusG